MTNATRIEPLAVPVLTAGAMLGIGRTKTLEIVAAGEIESILIGRKRLILTPSIHQYIERRQVAAAAKK